MAHFAYGVLVGGKSGHVGGIGEADIADSMARACARGARMVEAGVQLAALEAITIWVIDDESQEIAA